MILQTQDCQSNSITCIAIDDSDNKWIGTYEGLVKFDGSSWTVYNTSNSGLPINSITCIAIDDSDNKWIGTCEGMVKFDGLVWTVYNTSNSGLPSNWIYRMTIDESNIKWICTRTDIGWGGYRGHGLTNILWFRMDGI